MNGAIVEEVQRSLGQRFFRACAGYLGLESVEFLLSCQIKLIHQNG
jgi:hypothetical protein